MPHTHGTVNEVTRGSKAHQRRLMMTLTLTGTVFVAEIVGAIITGSLALLVDSSPEQSASDDELVLAEASTDDVLVFAPLMLESLGVEARPPASQQWRDCIG